MDPNKAIRKFVKNFCAKFNVDVCHDRTVEFCPCRFKLHRVDFCNFAQFIVDLSQEKGSLKYKKFLTLICKELSVELVSVDLSTRDIQFRMKNTVDDIESERIKLGDIVYCTKLNKEVIVLEFPQKKHFDIYHKSGVFPGDVKYKTFDGEIGLAPVACINRISRGNYVSSFDVAEKDLSSEKRVEYLERTAKRRGFRVKVLEVKEGYKLEFYGDTQQDVDEFVELSNLNTLHFW